MLVAQCEMKSHTESRKKVLRVLTYQASSFFPWSLSMCHAVLYLLFNAILSKGKLKFKILSMSFTIHLYIVQCQFEMQIQKLLTPMKNHQNYVSPIL